MLNALTIDVEDYFHVAAFAHQIDPKTWDSYPLRVERNTDRILDLLGERGVRATFFILGWVAERCPALIKRIDALGHEIGCHGYAHRAIYDGTYEDFEQDVHRAKSIIENITGRALKSYRAPSFSITGRTLWALGVLAEAGFEYDSSIFPVRHDLYGIPDAPRFPYAKVLDAEHVIKEFPPSTLRFCGNNFPIGGGGYLRLLPYRLTALAIRRLNKTEKQPAMIYLHPWEIDPEQPRIAAPWRSRFRQYQNLRSTERKLIKLLDEFPLGSMQDVLAEQPLETMLTTEARSTQRKSSLEQEFSDSAASAPLRSDYSNH
jgi:polysaccharide deacetylase family protein (PEP-CTERM system associated)